MSVNDIRQRALASLIPPPQRLPHLRAHDVAEIDAEARAALTEMLDCPIDHKVGAGRQRRMLVDGGLRTNCGIDYVATSTAATTMPKRRRSAPKIASIG